MKNETIWSEFTVDKLYPRNFKKDDKYLYDEFIVAYTPSTNFTSRLVEMTCSNLTNSFVTYNFMGVAQYPVSFIKYPFESIESMETFVTDEIEDSNKIFIGIHFHGDPTENKHLNYSIRPSSVPRSEAFEEIRGRKGWITNILFPERAQQKKDPFRSRSSDPGKGDKPHYFQEGFLTAQHFIDMNFMQLLAEQNNATFDKSSTS